MVKPASFDGYIDQCTVDSRLRVRSRKAGCADWAVAGVRGFWCAD